MQDALVGWLLEMAKGQPLVMVWEDLHRADPSTPERLGLGICHAPIARILTPLTFRHKFRPP